jgi:Protein of unknown function (DUF3626)
LRRVSLTDANRAALAAVRQRAERERPRHVERIERVLGGAGLRGRAESLLVSAGGAGSLTLNFHPDRLLSDGRSVAEGLHEEGVYRSQFETGVSSGALTAHPGGGRDVWERDLFSGAYQAPGADVGARPKYGGLNLLNHLNGACPGVGSCHLRLRAAAKQRATFVFGDSAAGPTEVGLIDSLEPVMAPVLERVEAEQRALGRDGIDVCAFVDGILEAGFAPAMAAAHDDYVEAQVHGVLSLPDDVEALVVDPAFAGTSTGELLVAAGERHGFEVDWHPGTTLDVSAVPDQAPDAGGALARWQELCRDGRARRLAERIVEEHGGERRLDAANIGQAAARAAGDPAALQDLKDLWVLLVTYAASPR